MKLAFNLNRFLFRGTQVAVYDYADQWEKICGGEAYICGFEDCEHDSLPKFLDRFGDRVLLYPKGNLEFLNEKLNYHNVKQIYWIKSGENDGIIIPGKRNLVHTVFPNNDPHGDVYTYISSWLADYSSGDPSNFVPHMVNLPKVEGNLKGELGIPEDAVVYGRYGGYDQFDIEWFKSELFGFAQLNPDVYFLFMNTKDFGNTLYNNIRYLKGTYDLEYKTKFINTCNYMLHARNLGESFGLSIAEFMSQGKPIITTSVGRDRNHIDMVEKLGFIVNNNVELTEVLKYTSLKPSFIKDTLYERNTQLIEKRYSPEPVMNKFCSIFSV